MCRRPYRHLSIAALAALLVASCATTPPPAPPAPAPVPTPLPSPQFQRAIGLATAADVAAAIDLLRTMPPADLMPRRAAARQCILDRFARDTPDDAGLAGLPPTGAAIALAYRRYWHGPLTHRLPPEAAEASWLAELARALPPTSALAADHEAEITATEHRVEAWAQANGLHALTGLTRPFHELMLWRSEQVRREHVQLPESAIEVEVRLLDDFVSLGWTAYATCDLAHTGGWADTDAIHALVSDTKIDSDEYRASLLAHEGQHMADHLRFPGLDQPDLEYRAKLAELWASRETTPHLLQAFVGGQRRDRALPHPFSDYWIVTRLRERLGTKDLGDADPQRVRAAAAALLVEHSAQVTRLGAATATTALPD
ncbi:MAG: hypothetical protein ABJD97_19985 [Betaproteobacteria bacterium]